MATGSLTRSKMRGQNYHFYSQVEIFQVKNYYTDNYFVDLGGIPKEQGRVGKGWEINTNFRTEKTIGEENQHLDSHL